MTTIIIPTYNEKENIEQLIRLIFDLDIPDLKIIVVDDNSPDGTAGVVKNLSSQFPIHIIERKEKLGLGSAYIAGFKKALELNAEHIFEMDADLSHDPRDLPRLLEKLQNYDLVIGSRKIPGGKIIGWGIIRKFMSNGAMIFARIFLGLKTKDVTSGFRGFRRSTIESLNLDKIKSNGYAFQEEILCRVEKSGQRVCEVPVTFVDRQKGRSKLSRKDIWEFFKVMLKLRRGKE